MLYRLQHGHPIACRIRIRKSPNAISQFFQKRIALRIVILARRMKRPVEFDNQHPFGTDEVRDVRADGKLSAEFKAAELAVSQMRPEEFFQRHGIVAHRFGARAVERGRAWAFTAFHPARPPHPGPLPLKGEREIHLGLTS